MTVNIERFTEFGKRRRVHRLSRPGHTHETLYVLWRSRDDVPAHDIFTGHPGGYFRRTVVIRVSRPCPPGSIRGHIRECMGVGQAAR